MPEKQRGFMGTLQSEVYGQYEIGQLSSQNEYEFSKEEEKSGTEHIKADVSKEIITKILLKKAKSHIRTEAEIYAEAYCKNNKISSSSAMRFFTVYKAVEAKEDFIGNFEVIEEFKFFNWRFVGFEMIGVEDDKEGRNKRNQITNNRVQATSEQTGQAAGQTRSGGGESVADIHNSDTHFINPYTFVPIEDDKPCRKEFLPGTGGFEGEDEEKLSGYLECSLDIKSPLFIPNTGKRFRLFKGIGQGLQEGSAKQYYTYFDEFFLIRIYRTVREAILLEKNTRRNYPNIREFRAVR